LVPVGDPAAQPVIGRPLRPVPGLQQRQVLPDA